MRTYQLSTLIGLTTSVTLSAIAPVQAANLSFDYNQLQFIKSRPIASSNFLGLNGSPTENQGFVPFYNPDPSAPDHGHKEIGLNSRRDFPGFNNAPYYGTGRQGSPEEPASGATRMTSLISINSFPSFGQYLTNYGIPLNDISFVFGQKSDRDFNKTWNLGADIFGQDWYADPNTPLEERIYKANPNDVEISLYSGNTKIVDFGYSDFYSIVDYGSTPSFDDDFESSFTDPIAAKKASDLAPLLAGLATAFLKDVNAAGGGVQIVNENFGELDINFASGNGYDMILLPYPMQIRAVALKAVPEASFSWGIFMFGVLVAVSQRKKLQN
ncbi:hypothetical protein [uncultured Nostoc sp.]|uniref:hypothetical protein n=1 Tax=uncultured Nostoc sp. TaxID=340711 RepID=UPI0035CA99A2